MDKMKKRMTVVIITLLALTAATVAVSGAKKASVYIQAVSLLESGEYEKAYTFFQKLGSYKDAEKRIADLSIQDPLLSYRILAAGDTICFGSFEQNDDFSDGPEPIEWTVLDKIDGRLLLLSSFCLTAMPYHTEPFVPVTWETCSLREWLNSDFLMSAFTEEEQALIPVVRNENDDHSLVETPGGGATMDRVFLLSETDTVIYLNDEYDQAGIGKAYATAFARAAGLQISEEGTACWWLRSPGMYEWVAQLVDQDGIPYANGAYADMETYCGVRPVIWLDVNTASGDHQS